MRLIVSIPFCFLLFLPLSARAERIELKNGDRISGQWLDSTQETVRFASKFGSVVRVPRDEVVALYADNGTPMAIPAMTQDALPAPKVVPAKEAAVAKKDQPGLFGAVWKNQVDAGAGLQTGNSDDKSVSADFKTKAKWDEDRANLNADYNWQESGGDRTQDNRLIEGNYDHFLHQKWLGDDKWYINGNGNLRQDKVADLELRSVLGVGLGRQFYETDETNLSVSFGPSWLRQKFYDGETDSSIAARWNFDYNEKFFDNLFQLFHTHSLYLPEGKTSGYLFDADSGVKIPLKGGFSATAEWTLNVNDDPAEDAGKSDSAYKFKLGYEW